MVEEDKRSATDILLSIEVKLNILDQRIQNSEYLLKSLLSKANKTQSIPPQPTVQSNINKENFENRPKTNRFFEMAQDQGVDLDNPKAIYKPVESSEMVESESRAPTRGQRGQKPNGGAKISVSQILSRGNDPLFLASIEILDLNDELIGQTRTNNKGRWMQALSPGEYQVHITKRFPPESGKKPIDTMYNINVPSTDKPYELDPHIVNN
jgi:hypothetical protein